MLYARHISIAPAAAFDMLNPYIIPANSQDAMLRYCPHAWGIKRHATPPGRGLFCQELLTWDSPPPAGQHCQSPTAASAAVPDLQPHQLPEWVSESISE